VEEYTHKYLPANRDLFQNISDDEGKYKTITSKLVREGWGRRAQMRLSWSSPWTRQIIESESLDAWEEGEKDNACQGALQ